MKIKTWHQFSIFDFKGKLNGRTAHGPPPHTHSRGEYYSGKNNFQSYDKIIQNPIECKRPFKVPALSANLLLIVALLSNFKPLKLSVLKAIIFTLLKNNWCDHKQTQILIVKIALWLGTLPSDEIEVFEVESFTVIILAGCADIVFLSVHL